MNGNEILFEGGEPSFQEAQEETECGHMTHDGVNPDTSPLWKGIPSLHTIGKVIRIRSQKAPPVR